MAVPTWLSAVGHFASDVIGAALGFQAVEARKKAAEAAGAEIKRVLMPDRAHIMQELLALGDETEELVELLKKAEEGFIKVGKKRYLENWIVSMLLKIEPRYRQPVFQQLNEVLRTKGEADFFTYLEILHNDGWAQYLKLAQVQISEAIGRVKGKLPEPSKMANTVRRADNTVNDTILGWRSRDPWWLRIARSRRRRRELRTQLDAREERLWQQREQAVRDRVAELFDQFRHEQS